MQQFVAVWSQGKGERGVREEGGHFVQLGTEAELNPNPAARHPWSLAQVTLDGGGCYLPQHLHPAVDSQACSWGVGDQAPVSSVAFRRLGQVVCPPLPRAESRPRCFLSPGFAGQNCEDNIDDCPGNNCKNGGTCVDGVNTYNCQCLPEWTGKAGTVERAWGTG